MSEPTAEEAWDEIRRQLTCGKPAWARDTFARALREAERRGLEAAARLLEREATAYADNRCRWDATVLGSAHDAGGEACCQRMAATVRGLPLAGEEGEAK